MQLVQGARQTSKRKIAAETQGLAGWVLGLLRSWRGLREVQGRQKQMHLVETLALGGKRQLMLVSCEGEWFLVGGGMESVETIVRVKAEVSSRVVAKDSDETCQ
jgi:flagellar biogenesis protein FliO